MTKQELASKIWETANELRKKIKADEFKDATGNTSST